jgi:hypothetical protein
MIMKTGQVDSSDDTPDKIKPTPKLASRVASGAASGGADLAAS